LQVVVDVRNEYETRIGKFKGAVDPRTVSFKDFPGWVEKNLLGGEADAPSNVDRVSSKWSASTAGGRQLGENQGDPRGSIEGGAAASDSPDSTLFAEVRSSSALGTEEESGSRGLEAESLEVLDEKGKGGRLAAERAKARKVAMYCTGGIRCEKSTSLLLQIGFKEVRVRGQARNRGSCLLCVR
jgi:rhodanese-related sulfurtransferase